MNIKLAAAGGIAALLFLSGCSDSSDEATAPETTAAPSAMASEPAMTEEPGTIVEVAAVQPRLRDPGRRGDRRGAGRDPVG